MTYTFREWDPTGTKRTYSYPNAAGKTLISVYDATTNSATLVNDPSVTGLDLTSPHGSSTEFRYFGPATSQDGTKGIVSFDPATGAWAWIIKEGGSGTKRISSFSSVAVSPDGTTLAFGLLRMVSGKAVPSLVRIPSSGGSYTPLVTYTNTSTNTFDAGALGWRR